MLEQSVCYKCKHLDRIELIEDIFKKNWEMHGIVVCPKALAPVEKMYILKVTSEPPIGCPYVLEHVLSKKT